MVVETNPTIDLPAPEREKPLAAMVPCPLFPAPFTGMEGLSGAEQALAVERLFAAAGEAYAVCRERNAAMAGWIQGKGVNSTD